MRILPGILGLTLCLTAQLRAGTEEWPMLAHDSQRSGATVTEIRPPFTRKWYRLFTDEGVMTGIQPIVAEETVFLGTLRGVFHAIHAKTGADRWSYNAEAAILQSAAAANGRVFFGTADGTIHALDIKSGAKLWDVQTGSAVWNAPAVQDDLVLIGSRDQRLYAIEAATGNVRWAAPTGGPLLGSPAVDVARGRVYIGAEDMFVYAFDLKQGELVWRGPKLPGVSLRGYHPVIAPDGSILITTAPGVNLDTFQDLLLQLAKDVFGDFASWRHSKEANAVLREENFAVMAKPETYARQMDFLRKQLTDQPALQTFFVLDVNTGVPKFVPPIVYSESMNGPGAPALVSPDGEVIVKFQALLRSRYEHYSPFLNVGRLNTTTGEIEPIMDQSRVYNWFESLLLVHDEQCQLSLSGRVLINTHQSDVNALDLVNLEGFPDPFCRNVHEPKPGEALAIWASLLRGESLPPGKEWLARGTAVYGGGSVLDSSISIAGDSFYYLPTHELNSGAALIAYQMNLVGDASKEKLMPPPTLSSNEWAKVQALPWDWDSLEDRRLTNLLQSLPGPVAGTRAAPLKAAATNVVARIPDSAFDAILWESPQPVSNSIPTVYLKGMVRDLARAVDELTTNIWQPLVFPPGKFPEHAYRFFTEPTETLYTLALVYPLLDAQQRDRLKAQVKRWSAPGGPLSGPVGQRTVPLETGQQRSAYDPAPNSLLKFQEDVLRTSLARLYPLWLWAFRSGDWSKLEHEWPQLAALINQRPNPMEEDCHNGILAGLIAYCRIADHMNDSAAVAAGTEAAKAAIRDRLAFELAHTEGGLIWQVPRLRSILARWRFLTPETGRLLGQFARPIHQHLMERYIDYHRPTWWLAWNVETLVRNECPYEFPSMSAEVFAARRLILDEPAAKLAPFIDRPWCHADLYYIQKLAWTIEAARPSLWVDIRKVPPSARQPAQAENRLN